MVLLIGPQERGAQGCLRVGAEHVHLRAHHQQRGGLVQAAVASRRKLNVLLAQVHEALYAGCSNLIKD